MTDFTEGETKHIQRYLDFSKKLREAERQFRLGNMEKVRDRLRLAETSIELHEQVDEE